MSKVTDLVKSINKSLTNPTPDETALEIDMDQKTHQMLKAIKEEQKPADEKIERLKKAVQKAFKNKYTALLEQIYQFSREDRIEVNEYGHIFYTFVLQTKYADLETMINAKVENIELTLNFEDNEYTALFRVETKKKGIN